MQVVKFPVRSYRCRLQVTRLSRFGRHLIVYYRKRKGNTEGEGEGVR